MRLDDWIRVGHALGELPEFPLRLGGVQAIDKQSTHLSLLGQQQRVIQSNRIPSSISSS